MEASLVERASPYSVVSDRGSVVRGLHSAREASSGGHRALRPRGTALCRCCLRCVSSSRLGGANAPRAAGTKPTSALRCHRVRRDRRASAAARGLASGAGGISVFVAQSGDDSDRAARVAVLQGGHGAEGLACRWTGWGGRGCSRLAVRDQLGPGGWAGRSGLLLLGGRQQFYRSDRRSDALPVNLPQGCGRWIGQSGRGSGAGWGGPLSGER